MLLDTSGLLSYFDHADARHADAMQLFDAADELLTHSYVLAELLPLCHSAACIVPLTLPLPPSYLIA